MAALQRLALRGTPKATKQAARYTPAGGAERCGMCRHYVPSSSCARIEGPVSAAGWCQLYSQQVTWRPRAGQDAGGGVPAGLSLDLSFMTPGTLDPRIVFTRASTGTYFDATGTLQTAATNTPRWDYDPVTHALNGLLIEEARTNSVLNSATLVTQSVTVTAVPWTLSFYGTGTVTKSGTATGALVGTGAGQRVSQTFTPTAGSLTLTVTGTVSNAQLEVGAFPTSYIPTTAASVTRAAEVCTMPTAAWFNAPAGSLATEFIHTNQPAASFCSVVAFVGASGNTDHINGYIQSSDRTWHNNIKTAGTAVVNSSSAPTVITQGAVSKGALTYSATAATGALNGVVNPGAAFSGTLPTIIALWFMQPNVNFQLSTTGYMRRARYWPRALTNAELQSVTT